SRRSAMPTPFTPTSPVSYERASTADSQSVTVAEAGRLWLEGCEAASLERSTLDYYRQHLERHIIPLIGSVKLSRLTVPMVRAFEDKLALDRSLVMVRKARVSLGALLSDAQERGLVGQNVVRTCGRAAAGARTHVPLPDRTASSRSVSTSR